MAGQNGLDVTTEPPLASPVKGRHLVGPTGRDGRGRSGERDFRIAPEKIKCLPELRFMMPLEIESDVIVQNA